MKCMKSIKQCESTSLVNSISAQELLVSKQPKKLLVSQAS